MIRAAVAAGVKYILPTEFGSDLEATQLVKESLPLWGKAEHRQLINELGGTWIAVINNPWFDWSLSKGAFSIDAEKRKATLWNGGNTKANNDDA